MQKAFRSSTHRTDTILEDTVPFGPYGEINFPPANAFGFTGQFQQPIASTVDSSTNLVMFPARGYLANIGRFLQTDPVAADNRGNLYAYVGNNPPNRLDPFGLVPTPNDNENPDQWSPMFDPRKDPQNIMDRYPNQSVENVPIPEGEPWSPNGVPIEGPVHSTVEVPTNDPSVSPLNPNGGAVSSDRVTAANAALATAMFNAQNVANSIENSSAAVTALGPIPLSVPR